MQENTQAILDNGTAMNMSEVPFGHLFKSDQLRIKDESKLVVAMITWADGQCKSRGMAVNPQNRRQLIGSRLNHIRFGTMTVESFLEWNKWLGSGFLTHEEVSLTVQDIHDQKQKGKVMKCSLFSSIRRTAPSYEYAVKFPVVYEFETYTHCDLCVQVSISLFENRPLPSCLLTGLRFLDINKGEVNIYNMLEGKTEIGTVDAHDKQVFRFHTGIPVSDQNRYIQLRISLKNQNIKEIPLKFDNSNSQNSWIFENSSSPVSGLLFE